MQEGGFFVSEKQSLETCSPFICSFHFVRAARLELVCGERLEGRCLDRFRSEDKRKTETRPLRDELIPSDPVALCQDSLDESATCERSIKNVKKTPYNCRLFPGERAALGASHGVRHAVCATWDTSCRMRHVRCVEMRFYGCVT